MRKHTGQYYHCDKCKFRTVNKSHLIEHQQTHANIKQQCNMCKKMYNTLKSLMSHIRKYHDNPKGKYVVMCYGLWPGLMSNYGLRYVLMMHNCLSTQNIFVGVHENC